MNSLTPEEKQLLQWAIEEAQRKCYSSIAAITPLVKSPSDKQEVDNLKDSAQQLSVIRFKLFGL